MGAKNEYGPLVLAEVFTASYVRELTHQGDWNVLAHADRRRSHRVGGYRVDLNGFEDLVGDELLTPTAVVVQYVFDEIGKAACLIAVFMDVAPRATGMRCNDEWL